MGRSINVLVTAIAFGASLLSHARCEPKPLSVHIPFAFSAQETQLPAGRYRISYDQAKDAWRLQTYGHADVEVKANWGRLKRLPARNSVLFEHVGDSFRLQAIEEASMTSVARIPPSAGRQEEFALKASSPDVMDFLRALRHAEHRQ